MKNIYSDSLMFYALRSVRRKRFLPICYKIFAFFKAIIIIFGSSFRTLAICYDDLFFRRLLYREALLLMKRHRINLNLIYDHNPKVSIRRMISLAEKLKFLQHPMYNFEVSTFTVFCRSKEKKWM